MRSSRTWVGLLLLCAVAVGCSKKKESAGPPSLKVAAASDLSDAFSELGKEFEARTGRKVEFTFGSTGQLAKQISQGAPFDVFASADVAYADEVIGAGACDPSSKAMYARGRIVVWTKDGSGVPAPTSLEELKHPRFVKIAIANPDHAPYGRAAKQALESSHQWDEVKSRIVYGENVRQTLQFVQTGNAEVAITALSLATRAKDGNYFILDDALHKPIDQALVVCNRGKDSATARSFTTFVNSPQGRFIMRRYGFLLPGEAMVLK